MTVERALKRQRQYPGKTPETQKQTEFTFKKPQMSQESAGSSCSIPRSVSGTAVPNADTTFARGAYPRVYLTLKSQRTMIASISESLDRITDPAPNDAEAVSVFRTFVNSLLSSTYGTVFDIDQEAVVSVISDALSPAVKRLGTRILMVCISFKRLKALLTLTDFYCASDLSNEECGGFLSPCGSPDRGSLLCSESSGELTIPSTVLCRVCEQQVPLDMIEIHGTICAKAYESSQIVKNSYDQIAKLVLGAKHSLLKQNWPGDEDRAVSVILPVLHTVVLLEKAVYVDQQSLEAHFELVKINDCLRGIRLAKEDEEATKFLMKATELLYARMSATSRLSKELDEVQKTVSSSEASIVLTETEICDFDFVREISRGAYALVFLARKKKTGDFYAIKATPKERTREKNEIDMILTERNILLQMESPYMIRFYYSIIGLHNLYIVMDYMPGGDLASVLTAVGKFSEAHAKFYTAEVVAALEFLREHDIIHRDLKPDNILVSKEGHLKLVDFGLSYYGLVDRSVAVNRTVGMAVGTPDYMPPEIIFQQEHSFSADYWSLGCIIYEFLTCLPPFHEDKAQDTFARVISGTFDVSALDDFSPDVRDLITKLLERNPHKRLGAASIEEIKSHPWFRGVDWDNLQSAQPPFVPELASEEDTSYFEFKSYEFSKEGEHSILEDIQYATRMRKATMSMSSLPEDSTDEFEDGIGDFPKTFIDGLKTLTMEKATKLRKIRAQSFCEESQDSEGRTGIVESRSFAGIVQSPERKPKAHRPRNPLVRTNTVNFNKKPTSPK